MLVLAFEQVGDHGLEIGRLIIGLAPDPAKPAQIVHHQVDIMVIPAGGRSKGSSWIDAKQTSDKNRDSSGAVVIRSCDKEPLWCGRS